MSMPGPAARAARVPNPCPVLQAGQGELLEAPPTRFVGASLSTPAKFVEPEAPSGALGTVARFSALEVPVNVEGFSDRLKRSRCLKPAAPGSPAEPDGNKPPKVGPDLTNGESSCIGDVADSLPMGPAQEPVDVPRSSS
jgi:hypothetical protein